jgi:hypothetical protein
MRVARCKKKSHANQLAATTIAGSVPGDISLQEDAGLVSQDTARTAKE